MSNNQIALFTSISFAVGALCSGLSGYIGMWASVRANVRVASAARTSYHHCIQVCLRSGAFCGIIVVALTLIGIAVLYVTAWIAFGGEGGIKPSEVPLLLVGYAFGASFVALFAQLGGGIYTKAADVGADMVGKVEADIPEDDPRNPAVIADLVGDNVGDCAGRGADLFESIAGEIIAAMILGGGLSLKLPDSASSGYVMFPLAIHALDLIASGVGIMMTEAPRGKNVDPMEVLKQGYKIAAVVAGVGIVILCRLLLHLDEYP